MKSKVIFENVMRALLFCIFTGFCSQTVFAQEPVSVWISWVDCSGSAQRDLLTEIFAEKGPALPRRLEFAGVRAGVPIAASRVMSVKAKMGSKEVPVKQVGPLDFVVEGEYTYLGVWQTLSEPRSVDESAFRSWSSDGVRLMFLGDLLPNLAIDGRAVPVSVNMICGGAAASAVSHFRDYRDAVVLSGGSIEGFAGPWPFAKSDADAMASDMLMHYSKNIFGTPPPSARFLFVRLPAEKFGRDQWAAQTIGSTVLIVSTGTQFPTQEKQRLHEQLRHEVFHLWFPNLAGLKGRYDWFYEGFALYESLKFAVNSGRITFDDFLSTLSGAYGIASRGDAVSLISLSETRFAGSDRQMYAKGMLVAFFTDVAMLDASGGRASSSDLVKSIFSDAVNTKGAVSNDLILRAFSARPELRPLVEAHITGKASFSESSYFLMAGLDLVGTTLHVVPKPSRREKAVLDKLGYNAWRKTAPIIK